MKRERFFQSLDELKSVLDSLSPMYDEIKWVAQTIVKSLKGEGKLMVCGNGGSAADAQHMAAELVNRFLRERCPLPAIALTTDSSVVTSIANDYSYDEVFSKQVRALGKPSDVLIGISTSGNSKNVYNAIVEAGGIGCVTIGLLGCDGGSIAPVCDKAIVIQSTSTPRIQEAHEFVIHTICEMIEDAFA